MPAFFPILETRLKHAFCYRQQLLFRFFFYFLNCSKMLSFHRCLRFWEEEKVSIGQVRWIRWLRHDFGFVFSQKLMHKHQCVRAGALSFCKIRDWDFHNSVHFRRIASRNWRLTSRQYSLLTVRPCGKNLWCTMPLQSKKSVRQNLHIWPNLTLFFRSWLFWKLQCLCVSFWPKTRSESCLNHHMHRTWPLLTFCSSQNWRYRWKESILLRLRS